MPDGVQIIGAEEVMRKLAQLPAKLQKKHIRKAIRNGGKKVLRKAKELVPYDTSGHQLSREDGKKRAKHLRDTLKLRVAKNHGRRGQISMKISTGTREELGIPADEKGYYPAALEYGGLAWQPMPYMRPAYTSTKDIVIQDVRQDVLNGIEQELR